MITAAVDILYQWDPSIATPMEGVSSLVWLGFMTYQPL